MERDIDDSAAGALGAYALERLQPGQAGLVGLLVERRGRIRSAARRGANDPLLARASQERGSRTEQRSVFGVRIDADAAREGQARADPDLVLSERGGRGEGEIEGREIGRFIAVLL